MNPPLGALGVTGADQTFWLIGLGIGLVVVAVVIALLTLLVRLVRYIDEGVAEVWATATRLAANTATTWQLHNTLHASRQLKDELRRHDQLLERL
jgi:Na+-transporting methylmalonyl-CoA/oxaloacetate decarboxylase gamma subunit